MLTGVPLFAQDSIVVGVVTDGPSDRMGKQQQTFVDELLALTGREFNVEIRLWGRRLDCYGEARRPRHEDPASHGENRRLHRKQAIA